VAWERHCCAVVPRICELVHLLPALLKREDRLEFNCDDDSVGMVVEKSLEAVVDVTALDEPLRSATATQPPL